MDADELLTLPESSYISVLSGSVFDMKLSQSLLTELNGSFADLNPPTLEWYLFDADGGVLHLQFSEPVLNDTFNATYLTLHSSNAEPINSTTGSFYTLTGAVSSYADNTGLLNLTLLDQDHNIIKELIDLAISRPTTYLSHLRGMVLDYSLNEAVMIPQHDPLETRFYIRDTTGPRLVSYVVDWYNEIIIFTFSETVNASSVDVTQFQFQNSISSAKRFYYLTNTMVITNDSTILIISFSEEDSNGIKAIDNLLTNINDTFIAIDREGLTDLDGNELVDIPPNRTIQAIEYIPDSIRPQLLEFVIDLDGGFIVLIFDETVNETTIDAKQITLLDAPRDFNMSNDNFNTSNSSYISEGYRLTLQNGFSNLDISHIVNISFSLYDLNELKIQWNLCTEEDNCYLSFTPDLVQDAAGLPVMEVFEPNPRPPTQFINDATPPALVHMTSFDLNRGVIQLDFTKTLNIDTLNLTHITFQSLFTNPTSTVELTGGDVPAINTSILEITLGQADLDRIKMDQFVLAYRGNCYISFTSHLVEDMNSNQVFPSREDFPGYIAQNFTMDTTDPVLEEFDSDLMVVTLLLSFSEPVDLGSYFVDEITLQGAENASNDMQYAVEAASICTPTMRTVLITLSADSVEELKSSQYFKNKNTTFLSLTEMTLTDLSFYPNEVRAISSDNSKQVRNFTADADGPMLQSFTLDYNTNQLLLTFNKPVLPLTFNFSQVSFSSEPTGGGQNSLSVEAQ